MDAATKRNPGLLEMPLFMNSTLKHLGVGLRNWITTAPIKDSPA